MLITKNNQTKLNLEDTVRWLVNNYKARTDANNLGVRLVGFVASVEEMPGPDVDYPFPLAPGYKGEYGDMYAVGEKEPYTYYIFTRADPSNQIPTAYWFNAGNLAIRGEKGEKGDKGDTGNSGVGSRWYIGSSIPLTASVGDIFMVSSGVGLGDLYIYEEDGWSQTPIANIRGPQGVGIRGEKGDKGDTIVGPQGIQGEPGLPFHIEGIVSSASLLPIPTQAIRAGAYLVGTANPYDLYTIVGGHEEGNVLEWVNAGNIVSVPGAKGDKGDKGDSIVGPRGYSIYTTAATINATPSTGISYSYPSSIGAAASDTIIDVLGNVYTVIDSNYCQWKGINIRGPQGEPGKVEYEVFSISSVYQPDYGIYINLPTIYKEVEVLSIMITPPSGKYAAYYWNSQGVPKKVIQNGSFIGGSFPMIKGSTGDSVGTLSGTTVNTNGVLNADGSKGIISIGLKATNTWSGDDLKTGQPTGIILVKCVR